MSALPQVSSLPVSFDPYVRQGEIYVLTFPNGKQYVGLTRVGTDKRFIYHKRSVEQRELAVYAAWRKYGEPSITTLGHYPHDDLGDAEKHWIATLNTMVPHGYNMHEGGIGGNITDHAKVVLSVKAKERWRMDRDYLINALNTPVAKERKSQASKARWKNEGYRVGQIERVIEQWKNEDFRAKHKNAMASVTVRNKMSVSQKKANTDPTRKQWYADKAKQQMETPSAKQNLSMKAKERFKDEGYRKKMKDSVNTIAAKTKKSNSLLKAFSKPEEKARRSRLNKTSPLRAIMYADRAKRLYTSLIPGVSR